MGFCPVLSILEETKMMRSGPRLLSSWRVREAESLAKEPPQRGSGGQKEGKQTFCAAFLPHPHPHPHPPLIAHTPQRDIKGAEGRLLCSTGLWGSTGLKYQASPGSQLGREPDDEGWGKEEIGSIKGALPPVCQICCPCAKPRVG